MADTRRLPVNGIPDPLYEAIITIAAREGKTLSRVGLDALELLARERGEWPPGRKRHRVPLSREDIARVTEDAIASLERLRATRDGDGNIRNMLLHIETEWVDDEEGGGWWAAAVEPDGSRHEPVPGVSEEHAMANAVLASARQWESKALRGCAAPHDATEDEKRAAMTALTIPQEVEGTDLNITIDGKLPTPLRVTVSRPGQPQRLYIARDEVVKVLRVTIRHGARWTLLRAGADGLHLYFRKPDSTSAPPEP